MIDRWLNGFFDRVRPTLQNQARPTHALLLGAVLIGGVVPLLALYFYGGVEVWRDLLRLALPSWTALAFVLLSTVLSPLLGLLAFRSWLNSHVTLEGKCIAAIDRFGRSMSGQVVSAEMRPSPRGAGSVLFVLSGDAALVVDDDWFNIRTIYDAVAALGVPATPWRTRDQITWDDLRN